MMKMTSIARLLKHLSCSRGDSQDKSLPGSAQIDFYTIESQSEFALLALLPMYSGNERI